MLRGKRKGDGEFEGMDNMKGGPPMVMSLPRKLLGLGDGWEGIMVKVFI